MAKKGAKGAKTTWIVFLNDYRLKNSVKAKRTKNADLMKEAAVIWKALSKTQQAAFTTKSAIAEAKEVLKEVKEANDGKASKSSK